MTQSLPKSQSPRVGLAKTKHRIQSRRLVGLSLAVAIGGGIAWFWLSRPTVNELEFSGRIEGYESDVGTKVAGRVEEVTVREGATVESGELLVRLDDDELQAEREGAEARLRVARQQAENARLQGAVLESQITENQYRLQQSQGDTAGQVAQAEAQLATATAQLRQAEAQAIEAQSQLALTRTDRDRYAQLVQDGAVAQQRYDQAQAAFESAQAIVASRQAAVVAAQRQVAAAEGQLTQAQTSTLNPDINVAQLDRLNTQLEQARALEAAAQAEVASAEANRQRIQAQLNNLAIVSPIEGVVMTRTVEPGVVVSPGAVLMTILDFDTVYMRGFIPEGEIGRVRVGQSALVYLDSFPDRPLQATVAAIDSEASFTPENIYFKDDRVQQVFGVRLALQDPDGFAKPGMPADAEIQPDAEPVEPNE